MNLRTTLLATVVLASTSAVAGTETISMCQVSVDFATTPKRKVVDAEGGGKVELLVAAVEGVGSQSAFCGPGTASSAAEMRDLTSFVVSSAKLRNVRSNVAKTPTGWMFLADADSMANDGVTPTRFEYQCRADTKTKHLLCLTVGARRAGFPRLEADRFFESVRREAPLR